MTNHMMQTGCRLVLIVAHVTVSNNHVFMTNHMMQTGRKVSMHSSTCYSFKQPFYDLPHDANWTQV